MSENETKQPSAGEVLTLVALMVEAKYEADTLPEGSDQRRARFAEYVNYEHRLRQFDPAHLRALAAPQPEREAARLATIPPEIAAVILAIGPAQWGVSVRQTAAEHGEMMTRSVRLTAEHFGQGDEPQPMQMLLREGTDTVIAYVGTSPHSAQAARGMTAAWNYLHRDCQALTAKAGEAP